MGGNSSAPATDLPKANENTQTKAERITGCLSKPWRDIPEQNEYSQTKDENLDFMTSYRPQNNEATRVRILLHGLVGAGKSSFINSVDSVLRGRMTARAPVDAVSSGKSYTKKYKTFKMYGNRGQCSFVFNDIMGFEKTLKNGVSVEDVKLALQGHVREGYEFDPERPLTEGDPGYNSEPTLDDKVHVLVSVVSAETTQTLTKEDVKKMRAVREAASGMGIPDVVIITKIDIGCSETQKDIKNAYSSKFLKKQADELIETLGVPLKSIFLVKNYESETRMDEQTDVLILMALKQMIHYGGDYLNDLNDQ